EDGKEGSEFECAGCHNKSTYHHHEIAQDSERYIFCSYSCLFDCANPLCVNGGKCYKYLIKSRSDGNFCSRKCLSEFRQRRDQYGDEPDPSQTGSQNCIKCNRSVSDTEERYKTKNGVIC